VHGEEEEEEEEDVPVGIYLTDTTPSLPHAPICPLYVYLGAIVGTRFN